MTTPGSTPSLAVHLLRVNHAFPGRVDGRALLNDSLDPLLELVDDQSRVDVRKFRFLADARRCLCGRLLARHVASSRLDQPWSSLTFKKSERGRPYLAQARGKGAPLLDLNTSHDGNLVAVASLLLPAASSASPSQPPPRVGVDVMRIRNPWEGTSVSEFVSGIAEQLAPRERSALSRLGKGAGTGSDAQRLRHALALWTLKEAFVKATGEGLHRDLLEVEFELEFSGRSGEDGGEGEMLGEGRLEGRRMDGWRFWIVDVDGGELESARTAYWLAVAEQTSDGTGEVRRLRREPEWVGAVELAEIEARARGAS